MKRVGILGGGQLGGMLAAALAKLDAEAIVYDPDPLAPARLRTLRGVTAPWSDRASLAGFFAGCDVVTYEFENVESATLRKLASAPAPVGDGGRSGAATALGARIVPSLDVLETTQDRMREKRFLAAHRLPHVAFVAVAETARLVDEVERFGLPAIVKTARGGYDGKGQSLVRSLDEVREIAEEMAGWTGGFVVEEPIDLAGELSVIVARGPGAPPCVFPVFENLHRDHILDFTVVPARFDGEVQREAARIAVAAAEAFDLHGLLTVEFFLGEEPPAGTPPRAGSSGLLIGGKRLFVNEFAPRPHNSGHVTLEATTFSQFDALARVLVGAPLHAPALAAPGAFCMGNLLGDVWLAQSPGAHHSLVLSAWRDFPDVVDVVLYGKREARPRRKMGHFVVRADDAATALARAAAFREALRRPAPR